MKNMRNMKNPQAGALSCLLQVIQVFHVIHVIQVLPMRACVVAGVVRSGSFFGGLVKGNSRPIAAPVHPVWKRWTVDGGRWTRRSVVTLSELRGSSPPPAPCGSCWRTLRLFRNPPKGAMPC